ELVSRACLARVGSQGSEGKNTFVGRHHRVIFGVLCVDDVAHPCNLRTTRHRHEYNSVVALFQSEVSHCHGLLVRLIRKLLEFCERRYCLLQILSAQVQMTQIVMNACRHCSAVPDSILEMGNCL